MSVTATRAKIFPYGPIEQGQRVAVFGRAGSGKTYLTKWAILKTQTVPWIVLDTKHDPNFDDWHPHDGLLTMDQLFRTWKERRIVVVRPTPRQSIPEILDAYLSNLHESFDNIGVAIDETYQVAFGPKAGPGLTGLVTRGRVRKQTVIMGSQRPAWVPRFVFTEANGYAIMSLTLMADRKTVYDMTGKARVLNKVEPRHWLYYDVSGDTLRPFKPVTITT